MQGELRSLGQGHKITTMLGSPASPKCVYHSNPIFVPTHGSGVIPHPMAGSTLNPHLLPETMPNSFLSPMASSSH